MALALTAGCAHQQSQARTANAAPVAAPAPVAQAAPASTNGCSRDLDCASNQICLDNQCQDVASHLSACTSVRVHFGLNDSDISTADRSDLDRAARCMKADHALHIAIQGNADERGTEEYNLSLGDRRAHAVAGYLQSLGASDSQLQTVSYGEEHPLCNQHDEACWAQNRRADLAAQVASAGKSKKRGH
ncbi:MAG TPA: OmpA family protein [Polyangia bacterium]|jgi:peptidoglycan-associated lipoprotein|nr:OmpA family protein [Polyangia bacterium]HWE27146.1 OmpA family protein [Polyangia bacterium]